MMKRETYGIGLRKMMFFSIIFLFALPLAAQEKPEVAAKTAKKYMQEAEEALAENDVASAEAFYRKAIAKDPSNAEARYNLGNLYYNKEITNEAVQRHGQAATVAETKPLKHDSFHNRGNALMKQKKYKEAVEAYKHSLRNNPKDEETRYNLALAKKMLEEEEKKGGGGDKDQQDKNEEQKEDQKDQQGDEGEKEKNEDGKPDDQQGGDQENKDKKEGEDKKDNEGDPKNQDKQEQKGGEQNQEQPQPRPGQLSPQQVKNLLEAMGNEEKKVQEKINAEKVKGAKTKTGKDW